MHVALVVLPHEAIRAIASLAAMYEYHEGYGQVPQGLPTRTTRAMGKYHKMW